MQGMADVTSEKWSGRQLSATSRLVAGDPYELRIAAHGWKVAGVDVPPSVQATIRDDGPLVRVTVQSPTTGVVPWKVRFRRNPGSEARRTDGEAAGGQVITVKDRPKVGAKCLYYMNLPGAHAVQHNSSGLVRPQSHHWPRERLQHTVREQSASAVGGESNDIVMEKNAAPAKFN